MSSIGNRIKELLNKHNISQKDLARYIGTTEASISRYVNDEREPVAKILYKIAQKLHTTTDYLISGVGDNNAKTKRKDKLERLKDWVVNNSHLMKHQIIGTEKNKVKSSVFVNSTSLIGRIEQLQRGCCEHDYKLTTFEQNKKDSKITTKLVFTCKTCKETHEYKTDKLLWEETNKSKRYLKEQVEFYKPLYFQEQQIIDSRIQKLSSQLKDQRELERLIAIYRPIVKNAKCLALNELRGLQMDILENPRTKIMDLIDKRKFQLEEEIANWRE